jgi:hypothetical protein
VPSDSVAATSSARVMPSSISVARRITDPSATITRMPPSDGRVPRVETARPTSWSAVERESRETESFIEGRSSSYLDQMYLMR